MSSEISPQFIASLTNALVYWRQQTQNLDDALIMEIDPERRNLHQVVVMGLDLPQTWELASDVALQTFFLAERKGYWQEWAGVFERALNHCQAIEPHRQGRLLNRLGELYRYMRRLEAAVAVHKEAEALAQEQDDDLALAEARYRLCWDYLETKQYGEAEVCCRFALKTFTHLGLRDDLLTNCYWALGSIARRKGDIAAAQELLTRAVYMGHTTQQPTHLARMLNELAWLLLETAAYEEALAYLAEAEQILAATASERDKIHVQLNRGLLFFRQEKWIEAELAWRYALNSAYLRQSGEIQLQAHLAHNLGIALLKQENLPEAEELFHYARQLRLELQDKLALANTLGGLAEVYARQGKQDEAISLFKEALQLLAAYPDDAYAQKLWLEFEPQLQALLS